eukprot:CFRG6024T1
MDVQRIKDAIKDYPDFPLPGIVFRDCFPIFQDPVLAEVLMSHLVGHCLKEHKKVDVVVGLDARGFLIGPTLAMRLGASFVPIRKQGKLPGKCATAEYKKEYGSDVFEIQENSISQNQTVVIVDDLLATGGTLKAAQELIEKCGGNILEALLIVELEGLNGKSKIPNVPVYSIVKY